MIGENEVTEENKEIVFKKGPTWLIVELQLDKLCTKGNENEVFRK